MSICVSAKWSFKPLFTWQKDRVALPGRGPNFPGARHSLGMQGGNRETVFHIIVLSSLSSRRYAFVCNVFFFVLQLPSSFIPELLCLYLCAAVQDSEWWRKGNTEEGKNLIFRSHECKFVLKKEKEAAGRVGRCAMPVSWQDVCFFVRVNPRVRLPKFTFGES